MENTNLLHRGLVNLGLFNKIHWAYTIYEDTETEEKIYYIKSSDERKFLYIDGEFKRNGGRYGILPNGIKELFLKRVGGV